MAETNAFCVDDRPQQTDRAVQPSGELKPPKVFAGTVLFNTYFLFNNLQY